MRQELVLLCEDNFQGHRWNYVELLSTRAQEYGVDVHIVTTAQALDELKTIISLPSELVIDVLPDARLATLACHANECGATRVVIPDADRYALRLARPGSWKSASELRLLVMREHAQPRANKILTTGIETIRRSMFRLASAQKNVRLLYLASALAPFDSRHAPDPVTLTPDEQPPVPLDPDRFWFAVLGALDERKNVPVVQAALDNLDPSRVGLVLAGRLEPRIADEVKGHETLAPVHILDTRLTDGELDSLVQTVDCLVLLYSNVAPSGMVAKAAAAGTRVILPAAPAYASDCARMGAGAAMCEISVEAATAAMQEMLVRPKPQPMPLGSDEFVRRLML